MMSPSFAPFPCGAHKPSCPALLRLAAGRRGVLLNALIQIRGDETPAVPLVTDRPFELEALEFAGALVLEEHPRLEVQRLHQFARAHRVREGITDMENFVDGCFGVCFSSHG